MRPAHVIEIITPKKFLLNGLWFGPKKPKRAIIWVHGLGSSAFSKLGIADELLDKDTAVLTFNNRGHDKVSHLIPLSGKKGAWAGETFELFTETVDDIQGAINTTKKLGIKDIYLVGHSTGCQKATYWAYKKVGKGVKGIIMLAPLSDYAAAVKEDKKGQIVKVTMHARQMIRNGKGKELLPSSMWPALHSAQRFISLHTADSVEQSIFSYFEPKRRARVYSAIKTPMLVLLAQKDEFGDREAREIEEWFRINSHSKRFGISIIPNVKHSFRGGEKQVASAIRKWIAA